MAQNSILTQVPQITDLAAYDVNRSGQYEGIKKAYYDFQTYAQAGQTSLSFFQVPVGQSSKTLADTNMQQAGSLPNPIKFLVQDIQIFIFPAGDPSQFGAQAAAIAGAQHDLPAIASKPAPPVFRRTCRFAALYAPEAADLVQKSRGICKGMPVSPLDADALGMSRQHLMTVAAQNRLFRIRCRL